VRVRVRASWLGFGLLTLTLALTLTLTLSLTLTLFLTAYKDMLRGVRPRLLLLPPNLVTTEHLPPLHSPYP
jgi:hypothetical protein